MLIRTAGLRGKAHLFVTVALLAGCSVLLAGSGYYYAFKRIDRAVHQHAMHAGPSGSMPTYTILH